MSEELERVRAERDELARQLDRVLFDLHPVYPNTTGPYGGVGGQAMTPWCHVIRPYTEEHEQRRHEAEEALRAQFLRAEREGYDLRAGR